jgi:hypothetical protein
MGLSHYPSLLVAYAAALLGWLVVARLLPTLWPAREPPRFARPWRETGWALLAAVAVLAIGQLYLRGWLIPSWSPAHALVDAVNQTLIFSPMLALLWLRKHPLETAWLPLDRIWKRVLVGVALAWLALLAFTLVRAGSASLFELIPRVYGPKNFSHLVQVFLEDITIAILFVRFRAAAGLRLAIVVVAALFSAGHIPSLLAQGAQAVELASLVLDTTLGVAVISVALRSRDVWWFWCVHFALDMTQYYGTV